jgi:HEAT repeat protein
MKFMRTLLFSLLAFFTPLFSGLCEKEVLFQIYSQVLIHDYQAAQSSAMEGLKFYPESKELRALLIKILAETGQEMEAFREWQKFDNEDDNVLESLAWGILEAAENSEQLVVHVSSMLGAAQTQDVRAVHLLQRQMRSRNAYVRAVAVNFTARFGDEVLVDELISMLEREQVWYVRLEVIKALSRFQVSSIVPKLRNIVGSSRTTIEEKGVAISSLVSMMETIDKEELDALITSPRAGLRQLACELILHLDLENDRERLVLLLDDTSNEVKCAALCALCYLGVDGLDLEANLDELRRSSNKRIAITAGWLSLFVNQVEGYKTLYTYAVHPDADVRRLASSAIGAGGDRGALLAQKLLRQSDDPYVRVNLALSLIGYQTESARCCNEIAQFLEGNDLIMQEQYSGLPFTAISPSQVRHIPQVSQYPKMIDQRTRLGMYNHLAVMRYPKAIDAIKGFLARQTVGIPFMAAQVLMREGGGESIDLVRQLLTDKDEKIRLQAAIVLAILNPEDNVISVIEEVYPHVDRSFKLQIIEALGYFGSRKSLPFLVKRLGEPYSVLRIASASAIIQSLNH